MKIIILSDNFSGKSGGAANIAYEMARGLKRALHDVHVITSVQDRKLAGKKIVDGISIWSVYSNYNLFWRAYWSLYNPQTIRHITKIIEEVRPDIVHAHNIHIYLSYYALKLAQKSNAKVFLTAHDVILFHYGKLVEFINPNNLFCPENFNYKISVWQQIKRAGKTYNPFRNIMIKYYLKYVDKIFTVSGALKDALAQNGIKNVEVIHNGINASEWEVGKQTVNDFKNRCNLSGKKIILFGGRLDKLKGSEQIIGAMSRVFKKIPEAVLMVLGERSGYAQTMLELAQKYTIEKNIIFTGWLSGDDLKAAFNAADIITIPSVCFDSFPTINLEAMACKKPVIATCFGGSKEVVLDGQTGYILNPYNTKLMAEKIIDLIKNPAKARTFGQAGYERVKNEFSLEKQAKRTMEWYQRMPSDKRPS